MTCAAAVAGSSQGNSCMAFNKKVLKRIVKQSVRERWAAARLWKALDQSCSELPRSLAAPRTRQITIGSCCSGWCSELFAARLLGLNARAVFACDNWDPAALVTLACHQHDYYFNDVFGDFMSAPSVDLLLAGAPCQPWSSAGANRGVEDDNGILLFPVLKWIQLRLPRVLILEQVASLLTRHPESMGMFLDLMGQITESSGQPAYSVTWEILNCRKHGYIPQNRERLFIVAVRSRFATGSVRWPSEAAYIC